jgi:myo-inositol 2-dehydrogenase/D-chiro-inositol 1-dehydrogenase
LLKIGFVGTGKIAHRHFRNLRGFPEVRIEAICDPSPQARKAASEATGARAYDGLSQMISEEDLDAAFVCIPIRNHGDVEIQLAEAGIHPFIEKPIAIDMETATGIVDAIDGAGVISSVGYHWRYGEAADQALSHLEGRTVGMILGFWMTGLPPQEWWRRKDHNPAQIFEQTTHLFDLSRYLVGEVSEVSSLFAMRSMEGVSELEDVSIVTLSFESGAIGSMASTYLVPYRHHLPTLHSWAVSGHPLLGRLALGAERLGLWRRCYDTISFKIELMLILKDTVLEIGQGSLTVTTPKKQQRLVSRRDPYLVELEAFLEAVRTGDPSKVRSPYRDALLTHQLVLAAIESAEARQPVKFERS